MTYRLNIVFTQRVFLLLFVVVHNMYVGVKGSLSQLPVPFSSLEERRYDITASELSRIFRATVQNERK